MQIERAENMKKSQVFSDASFLIDPTTLRKQTSYFLRGYQS